MNAPKYRYSPLTPADVERSFWAHKLFLSEKKKTTLSPEIWR